MAKVKIVQPDVNPVPFEVVADSIVAISDAMKKISETRLTRRAVVALIHENSGVARKTIEIVLNNMELLEEIYLKKK